MSKYVRTLGFYARLYSSSTGLKSDQVFSKFTERVNASPNFPKQVNALFLWKISKEGAEVSQWTLDLRSGKPGSVYQGEPKDVQPQCTISVADDDLAAIADGSLDAQKAFMSGKMKVTGNIMLMMKLRELFKSSK